MMVIGLIGQTGAGKSMVSRRLQQYGCCVIDGDEISREVLQPGSTLLQPLCARFGGSILRADGSLDRGALAKQAFATPEALQDLNAITHPAITGVALQRLREAEQANYAAAIMEGAALLESPLAPYCDFFVAVTAPEDVRLGRLLQRDQITHDAILQRMRAQQPERYYIDAAKIIIRNHPPYTLDEELQPLLVLLHEFRRER